MGLFKDLLILPDECYVEENDICNILSLVAVGLVVCHLSGQRVVALSVPVSARDAADGSHGLVGPLENTAVVQVSTVERTTLMDVFLAVASAIASARNCCAVPCPTEYLSSVEVRSW